MDELKANALYQQYKRVDYNARAKKGLGFSNNPNEEQQTESQRLKRQDKDYDSKYSTGIQFCKAGDQETVGRSLTDQPKSREYYQKKYYDRDQNRSKSRSPSRGRSRSRSRHRSRSLSRERKRRRQEDSYDRRSTYQPYRRRENYRHRSRSRSPGYRRHSEKSRKYRKQDFENRGGREEASEKKLTPLERLKAKTKKIMDRKTKQYIDNQAPLICQNELKLSGQDGIHVPEVESTYTQLYQGQQVQGAEDHHNAIFGSYSGQEKKIGKTIDVQNESIAQMDARELLSSNVLQSSGSDWKEKLMKLQKERQSQL